MVFNPGVDHHRHTPQQVIALATIKGSPEIADIVIAAQASRQRLAIDTIRSGDTTHILIGQPLSRFSRQLDITKPVTRFSFK